MPKTAACALTWSPERGIYELRRRGDVLPLHMEDSEQFIQLLGDDSFAFRGQWGRLTLRKEARQHGEGYWYAYRSQGRKTLKRYAGRASDLTIARLEEIAGALNAEPSAMPSARGKADAAAGAGAPGATQAASARRHMPLLLPKLSLPRLSSALVARERLLARLDAGLAGCRLTLVSAPAGFGKTTLVRQWIAHRGSHKHGPVAAWFSLDDGDNDSVRFWSYVIAACQTFKRSAGQAALTLLHTTEQLPFERVAFETPLTFLLNDLNPLPEPCLLVLEDYHVITTPLIHESLTFLLDHLPARMHLVILTRVDPPLPLARLRATGELNEFGADDLRFSHEETRDFLSQTLTFLPSPELVARLDTSIEGWPTGLRLLTLALREYAGEQDLERELAGFSGSQSHLLAYFASEVLATQPEEIQMFLLQTSMLHSLTAPLCEAVTGVTTSARMLETLEQANLFLSPLAGDERWYRYHPLFAEVLQHEARRRLGSEVLRACSQRASEWFAQHGLLTEAIETSLAACAFTRAAALIEEYTGPQRFHEMHEHHTLHRWLDALPAAVLEQHPLLCLTLAMVLLFSSDCRESVSADVLEQVKRALHMAERAWQAEEHRAGLGEALAFRTVLARFQGKPDLAARQARQALAWLPEDAHQWRATCLSSLGKEALLAGNLETARQIFLEARANFAAAGNMYGSRVTLLALGEICFLQGALHQAAELYGEVLATAGDDLSDRGKALLGLATLSYEWNDLTKAEQEARAAGEIGQRLAHNALLAHASLILASIQHARGQGALARQQFAALLAHAQIQQSPRLYREVLARETRLQLADGNLEAARRWLALRDTPEMPVPLLQREQEDLLSARLLIAVGQIDEALCLLARIQGMAHDQGRARSEIEALLLMALAHFRRRNLAQSWQRLCEALAPSQSGGYLRLFLDEGEPMADLLRAVLPLSEKRLPAVHIRSLLLTFARQNGHSAPAASASSLPLQPIEPLSAQEQRVLHLLAAGSSNREIAEALVVSPNTVKTQVQSIYRKLNLHSRREVRELLRASAQL